MTPAQFSHAVHESRARIYCAGHVATYMTLGPDALEALYRMAANMHLVTDDKLKGYTSQYCGISWEKGNHKGIAIFHRPAH